MIRRADLARLIALAAIWGGSFVFIRVLAPVIGPAWTAAARLLIAGVALLVWLAVMRIDAGFAQRWRVYVTVGMVNCAIPFLLFGYAALQLPASYMVILNSASPLFAALASAMWLGERLSAAKVGGLAIGAAGVTLVSRAGPLALDTGQVLAIVGCLGAALCYGLGGVYLKRRGAGVPAVAIAAWSQMIAGIALLPLAIGTVPNPPLSWPIAANLLVLALLCSGVAYLLYFRLIADLGPTRALLVTFLMPAFGMLWGAAFLGEAITLPMLAGAALVVAGSAAVLRPAPSAAAA